MWFRELTVPSVLRVGQGTGKPAGTSNSAPRMWVCLRWVWLPGIFVMMGRSVFLYVHLYGCGCVLYERVRGGHFLSLVFMLYSSLWADKIAGHLSTPGGKRKLLKLRFTVWIQVYTGIHWLFPTWISYPLCRWVLRDKN